MFLSILVQSLLLLISIIIIFFEDTEEIMLTFTNCNKDRNANIMVPNARDPNRFIAECEEYGLLGSHEIKSYTDIQLWQKFILFFLSEKHDCSEIDLEHDHTSRMSHNGGPEKNESFVDFEVIDDEIIDVKHIFMNDYNANDLNMW